MRPSSNTRNWKKGTRALRWRTARLQPDRPMGSFDSAALGRTPGHSPPSPSKPEYHVCAECFGPRSRYARGQFCSRCERKLFSPDAYTSFIRSERRLTVEFRKRQAARGYVMPDHGKEPA